MFETPGLHCVSVRVQQMFISPVCSLCMCRMLNETVMKHAAFCYDVK